MNTPRPPGPSRSGMLRRLLLHSVLPRVPMLAFILATTVLAWWTWNRLGPEVLRQTRQVRQHQEVLGEVIDLRRRHKAALDNKASESHAALIERLFRDSEGVMGWIQEDLARDAATLGFDLEASSAPSTNAMVVAGITSTVFRVTLNLRSKPGTNDPAESYASFLRLLDHVVASNRWTVVDGIRVKAHTNALLHAAIDLHTLALPPSP